MTSTPPARHRRRARAPAAWPRPRVPLLRAANLVLRRASCRDLAVGGQAAAASCSSCPGATARIVGHRIRGRRRAAGRRPRLPRRGRARLPLGRARGRRRRPRARGPRPRPRGRGRPLDRGPRRGPRERRGARAVSVLGVKYTTARAVAEPVVDAALRRLGRPASPSRTETVALPARPLHGHLADAARAAVREEMALHLDRCRAAAARPRHRGPPAVDGRGDGGSRSWRASWAGTARARAQTRGAPRWTPSTIGAHDDSKPLACACCS